MLEAWKKCCLPDDLPFEGWVDYVFEHPVLDLAWWWQSPESGYLKEWNESANPARTLSYLTRLFREPASLLERFSRAQIDQGLKLLVDSSCSSHMHTLSDAKLPWPERRSCFDSMIPLYAELMAPVYGNDLGHLLRDPVDTARPNFACYMWWDVITVYGGQDALYDESERTGGDLLNQAVLHVFEEVLRLKAESCLESALHGLGHWHLYMPDRTEPIVRRFLLRTDLSPELRRYAEDAAVGGVQ